MTKSLLRDAFILVAIFGLIWGIFWYFPIFSPEETDFGISIEQEEKLGKMIVENLIETEQTRVASNPALDSAMNVITERLISGLDSVRYNYRIKVINNPQINAFTLPGGNIFFYSGLIQFSESPEEVAAVLAHEMGHAEKRHVVNRLAKEIGITVLFTVLTGGDGTIIREIAQQTLSTAFDREQEKEADEFSFALMERSNIHPKALASFFKRVSEKHGSYNKNLEVLMTHPNDESRIKAAMSYRLSKNFKAEPFNLDWERVKAAVAGKIE